MTDQTLAMESEQLEVLSFLEKHPPFSGLPAEVLHTLAKSVDVQYFKPAPPLRNLGNPRSIGTWCEAAR